MISYKKIFVLDKSALVNRPNATLTFGNDNLIVIPFVVVQELHKLTEEYSEKAKNAQSILNYLDRLPTRSLTGDGVTQNNGSILRLMDNSVIPDSFKPNITDLSLVDKSILRGALYLKSLEKSKDVILIASNSSLRLKAKNLGIKAQKMKDEIFPILSEQYTGRLECTTSSEKISKFFSEGYLEVKDIHRNKEFNWFPNMFLHITDVNNSSVSALGRFDGKKIVPLVFSNHTPYGAEPQNVGQKMVLEALLSPPEIAPIVVIKGNAGTGKTYLSLAAALDQTIKENAYERILITTPTEHTKDLGYLPGDLEKKMSPRLGGIRDNLNLILRRKQRKKDKNSKKDNSSYHHYFNNSEQDFDSKNDTVDSFGEYTNPADTLINSGLIEVQLISYLRGRSIINTIFIIDETQNIDPDDIKSIVTRAGKGSKFVFLGDPTQIDNPKLNEEYNGLVFLSEKMKNYPGSWIISLKDEESVRSALARYAAKIL